MKKLLLPHSLKSRMDIAEKVFEQCNQLEPGSLLIPNTVAYRVLLNREEAAEYIHSTAGTLKTWDSTKAYDLNPLKSGSKVVYRLFHLDQFLERSLFAN